MTSAVLVRQPIRRGETRTIVDRVTDRLREHGDAGPEALVPTRGVCTASLFLGEPPERPDSLVWYLETEGEGEASRDDAVALVRESPLLDGGLADRLATRTAWDVFSAGNGSLAVHATLSGRPRSVATTAEDAPIVVRDGDVEPARGVVLLRVSIEPGPADLALRAFVRVMRRLDEIGWVERRVDAWTQSVLEAEAMYTESIFVERTATASDLLWYMEVADFAAAVDAYERTPALVARASEAVLARVFENPAVLREPDPGSEYALLAHAVGAERP